MIESECSVVNGIAWKIPTLAGILREYPMTEKRLLFSLFILFALSAAYLFSVNERGLDPDHDKSWWSLAFASPQTRGDLSFVIANHTATDRFQYSISVEGQTSVTSELVVDPGNSMTHTPSLETWPQTGRITITVTHEGQDESIYLSL